MPASGNYFPAQRQIFQGPVGNSRSFDTSGKPDYWPTGNSSSNPGYGSIGYDSLSNYQTWNKSLEDASKTFANLDDLPSGPSNPYERVETERHILTDAWQTEGPETVRLVFIHRLIKSEMWATAVCPYTKARSTNGIQFQAFYYNPSYLARVPLEGVSHTSTSYSNTWTEKMIRLGHSYTDEVEFADETAGKIDTFFKLEVMRQAALNAANQLIYTTLIDSDNPASEYVNEIYDYNENNQQNDDIYHRTQLERTNWACMQKDARGTENLFTRCRARMSRQGGHGNVWAMTAGARDFLSEVDKNRNVFIESGKTLDDPNWDPIKSSLGGERFFEFAPIKIGAHRPDFHPERKIRYIGDYATMELDMRHTRADTYQSYHCDTTMFSMRIDDHAQLSYVNSFQYLGYYKSDAYRECDIYSDESSDNQWPEITEYGESFFRDCNFNNVYTATWYDWLKYNNLLDFWVSAFTSTKQPLDTENRLNKWWQLVSASPASSEDNENRRSLAQEQSRSAQRVDRGRIEAIPNSEAGKRFRDEDVDMNKDDEDDDDDDEDSGPEIITKLQKLIETRTGSKQTTFGIKFLLNVIGTYEENYPDSKVGEYLYHALQKDENQSFTDNVDAVAWSLIVEYMADDNINRIVQLPLKDSRRTRLPLEEKAVKSGFQVSSSNESNQLLNADKESFYWMNGQPDGNPRIHITPFLVGSKELDYRTQVFTLTTNRVVLFDLSSNDVEPVIKEGGFLTQNADRIGSFYYSWLVSRIFYLINQYIVNTSAEIESSDEAWSKLDEGIQTTLKSSVWTDKRFKGPLKAAASLPILECQLQLSGLITNCQNLVPSLLYVADNSDPVQAIRAAIDTIKAEGIYITHVGQAPEFEDSYSTVKSQVTFPEYRTGTGAKVPSAERELPIGKIRALYPGKDGSKLDVMRNLLARGDPYYGRDLKAWKNMNPLDQFLWGLYTNYTQDFQPDISTEAIMKRAAYQFESVNYSYEHKDDVKQPDDDVIRWRIREKTEERYEYWKTHVPDKWLPLISATADLLRVPGGYFDILSGLKADSSILKMTSQEKQEAAAEEAGVDRGFSLRTSPSASSSSSSAELLESLKQVYLSDARPLRFFAENDLPTGFKLVACRPFQEWEAAVLLYFKDNGETARLMYRDIHMLLNEDANTLVRRGSFAIWMAAVLIAVQNRVRAENVFITGYNGGQSTEIFNMDDPHQLECLGSGNTHECDIFLTARPQKHSLEDAPVIAWLGEYEPMFGANAIEKRSSWLPGRTEFIKRIGPVDPLPSDFKLSDRRRIPQNDDIWFNRLCFQSIQRKYSENYKEKYYWISGKGHWGNSEGAGSRAWRTGDGNTVPRFNYTTQPLQYLIGI